MKQHIVSVKSIERYAENMPLRNSHFLIEILVLCAVILRTSCKAPVDIQHAMKVHHLIPDVLDKAPDDMVEVTYPDGVMVDFGNQLGLIQTITPPLLNWPTNGTEYFTLVMIDADFFVHPEKHDPTLRPRRTEWKHWLLVNIQGSQFLTGKICTEYIPPHPMEDRALHRYVFILFKQEKGEMQFHESYNDVYDLHRENFSTRAFMQNYNFSSPMAINFFRADF